MSFIGRESETHACPGTRIVESYSPWDFRQADKRETKRRSGGKGGRSEVLWRLEDANNEWDPVPVVYCNELLHLLIP